MSFLNCIRLIFLILGIVACHGSKTQTSSLDSYSRIKVAAIGSFNLLRLGHHKTKDLYRVAEIINNGKFHILAVQEIMVKEAAYELLEILQKKHTDWRLNISINSNGEGAYREFFGYYYRAKYVKPVLFNDRYCFVRGFGVERNESACFAKDQRRHGPDFERDPYVGHFKVRNTEFALISVHLVYGDTGVQSIQRRQDEALNVKRLMQEVRKREESALVIALGDFNLHLKPKSLNRPGASFPDNIFKQTPKLVGYISDVTTVGDSSYDHFLMFADYKSSMVERSEKVLSDFSSDNEEERGMYRNEVSDHLPILAEFYIE